MWNGMFTLSRAPSNNFHLDNYIFFIFIIWVVLLANVGLR